MSAAKDKEHLRRKVAREFLNRRMVHGRTAIFGSVLFGALGTFCLVGVAYATSRALAGVIVGGLGFAEVGGWLLLFAGAGTLRSVFAYLQERFAAGGSLAVRREIRSRIVARMVGSGPAGGTAATATALIEQVDKLEGYYARFVPLTALAGVSPLIILAFVFPVNAVVGAILLFSAPLIPLYMALVGLGAEEASRRQFDSMRRLSGYFLDRLQGLQTLRRLGYAAREKQNIARASEELRQSTMKVLRIAFLSSTVLEFFSTFSLAIAATYVGLSLLGWISFGAGPGGLSLRDGLFLLLLAPAYFQPLRDFAAAYHDRADALAATEDLMPLVEEPDAGATPEPRKVSAPKSAPTVELRGATVRYGGRQTPALDGATLAVDAGDSVALVGPSGSGKSTLLGLVAGQISPSDGEVSVGGLPATQASAATTAWVGQRPYLFPATIRENIAFGQREKTSVEVEEAAERARVLDFASRLPEGLDTKLGERGGGLSGGEAQRVALARAFLKDAPVVLLDEPTENLDAATEEELVETIGELIRGRTALISTHRQPLAGLCDGVAYLGEGRVLEVRSGVA